MFVRFIYAKKQFDTYRKTIHFYLQHIQEDQNNGTQIEEAKGNEDAPCSIE